MAKGWRQAVWRLLLPHSTFLLLSIIQVFTSIAILIYKEKRRMRLAHRFLENQYLTTKGLRPFSGLSHHHQQ
jgi:hypothetical protein